MISDVWIHLLKTNRNQTLENRLKTVWFGPCYKGIWHHPGKASFYNFTWQEGLLWKQISSSKVPWIIEGLPPWTNYYSTTSNWFKAQTGHHNIVACHLPRGSKLRWLEDIGGKTKGSLVCVSSPPGAKTVLRRPRLAGTQQYLQHTFLLWPRAVPFPLGLSSILSDHPRQHSCDFTLPFWNNPYWNQ